MLTSSLTRPVELSPQPGPARRELARMLVEAGWAGDVDAVSLAVHEAMVNSQRHAGGVVRATACLDDGAVVVTIIDRGRGFGVPASPEMPDAAAETGRGLYLIRRLASHVEVVRSGGETRLGMRFER